MGGPKGCASARCCQTCGRTTSIDHADIPRVARVRDCTSSPGSEGVASQRAGMYLGGRSGYRSRAMISTPPYHSHRPTLSCSPSCPDSDICLVPPLSLCHPQPCRQRLLPAASHVDAAADFSGTPPPPLLPDASASDVDPKPFALRHGIQLDLSPLVAITTPMPQLPLRDAVPEHGPSSATPTPANLVYARPSRWSEVARLTDDPTAISISLTPTQDPSDIRFLDVKHGESVTIGRASQSRHDLQAASDNALFDRGVVSRRHAELDVHPGKQPRDQVTITDRASMHGTFVNDRRLPPFQPHPLRTGDEIKLGSSVTRGAGKAAPPHPNASETVADDANPSFSCRHRRGRLPLLQALRYEHTTAPSQNVHHQHQQQQQ